MACFCCCSKSATFLLSNQIVRITTRYALPIQILLTELDQFAWQQLSCRLHWARLIQWLQNRIHWFCANPTSFRRTTLKHVVVRPFWLWQCHWRLIQIHEKWFTFSKFTRYICVRHLQHLEVLSNGGHWVYLEAETVLFNRRDWFFNEQATSCFNNVQQTRWCWFHVTFNKFLRLANLFLQSTFGYCGVAQLNGEKKDDLFSENRCYRRVTRY